LWTETDGVIEWMHNFTVEDELEPPSVDRSAAITNTEDQTITDLHDMFLDMFKTGSEMIEQKITGIVSADE
jgi:hypothetical protein